MFLQPPHLARHRQLPPLAGGGTPQSSGWLEVIGLVLGRAHLIVPQGPWSLSHFSAVPSCYNLLTVWDFLLVAFVVRMGLLFHFLKTASSPQGVEQGACLHSHLPALLTLAHTRVHTRVHACACMWERGREEAGHPSQPEHRPPYSRGGGEFRSHQ